MRVFVVGFLQVLQPAFLVSQAGVDSGDDVGWGPTWQKKAGGLYSGLQDFASTDAGSAQGLRGLPLILFTNRQVALPASLEFPSRGVRRPPSDFRHTLREKP